MFFASVFCKNFSIFKIFCLFPVFSPVRPNIDPNRLTKSHPTLIILPKDVLSVRAAANQKGLPDATA
jgi:hypothetical protein